MAGCAHNPRHIDPPLERSQQPAACLVAAGNTDCGRTSAESGDVVRRIPRAAGHDLGGVVVEDQDGRLTRHARDLAIDELIDEKITKDRDAKSAKRVDQVEEASRFDGWTPSRLCHGCLRIQLTA